jgi:hypothetical protein
MVNSNLRAIMPAWRLYDLGAPAATLPSKRTAGSGRGSLSFQVRTDLARRRKLGTQAVFHASNVASHTWHSKPLISRAGAIDSV